jgi:hypothetical protein
MATVTSINLFEGAEPVHVTVEDQNGNPLQPANVAWAPVTGITINPDATGFGFTVDAGIPPGQLTTAATYTGPGAVNPVVGPALTIDVTASVTALEYASP